MINTLLEAIDNDVENLLTLLTTLPKSNLNVQEKEAFKELPSRHDLITSKSDKSRATIIQDTETDVGLL